VLFVNVQSRLFCYTIKLSPSGSRRIWEKVRDADGQNETVPE
jgi:hypothetical protein